MKKRMLQVILMLFLTIFVFVLPNAFGEEKPLAPGEGTTVAVADQGEEERPTLSADVAFLSKYVWVRSTKVE